MAAAVASILLNTTACATSPQVRCSTPIPDLFQKASPAVVMITGQTINPYKLEGRVSRTLGSGFILDAEGTILTNSHVVFGRQSLTVVLDDGSTVAARLLGADPIFDLALIRIPRPARGTLPTLTLGDSDKIRVGEEVIAIGNPLGLDQTVTRGIISGINRILPETPLSIMAPMIQTDAPINPGNSGGPLLNRCGEVVGINSSIIPEAQNIGFSIPINLAKSVMPSLIKNGRVIRPWIGFHGAIIGEEFRSLLKLDLVDGLLVEVIEPGSPAEQAGLRGGQLQFTVGTNSVLLGGDIVTEINGMAIRSPEKLGDVMRSLSVGGKLRLKLYRDGAYREVEYVLPERPLFAADLPPEQADLPIPVPRNNAWKRRNP